MKKSFIITLVLLFVFSNIAGCGGKSGLKSDGNEKISQSNNPDKSESKQTPEAPNTFLPQIMIDDEIYFLHSSPDLSISYLPESYYKGSVLSTVPLSQIPTENGQANFDVEIGAPYAKYGDGYIVLWKGIWTVFVTEGDLV